MTLILHLISEADWALARAAGEWRPPSLEAEGFIHCSKDEDQMLRVAQRLYAGRADLLALEVDAELVKSSVIYEPSRSGEIYPHIYGPLPTETVVNVLRLEPDDKGNFFVARQ